MIENIDYIGHATFRIRGSRIIIIDPYQIKKSEKVDIILITHSHFDHCSPEDIKKITGNQTTIVASRDCVKKLRGISENIIGLEPFQKAEIKGISIEAVPAYNINKNFHPRENKWNGYVFTMDRVRYYHPGDTDVIPEMKEIRADIAFLPVGGTYTMDYNEAVEAVTIINPKVAIPMHYGSVVGSKKDAEKFVTLIGEKGKLLNPC